MVGGTNFSDFSIKRYSQNTKTCSHGVVHPKIIQDITCMTICSMMATEFDFLALIRVVALSLSFPMIGGRYFSDVYFVKYSKNTR